MAGSYCYRKVTAKHAALEFSGVSWKASGPSGLKHAIYSEVIKSNSWRVAEDDGGAWRKESSEATARYTTVTNRRTQQLKPSTICPLSSLHHHCSIHDHRWMSPSDVNLTWQFSEILNEVTRVLRGLKSNLIRSAEITCA